MRIIEKIREYMEHGIDVLTMAVFLLIFLLGLYAIVDVQRVNASAEIDEEIKVLTPSNDDEDVDMDALRAINPEIVGWVRIDQTNINYPVVQASDNTKYLIRDYRGEYGTAGSVFVDYRNNKFIDDFTIIYAHRMSVGLMFGDVTQFKDRDYFNAHKTGKLYTEDVVYDLVITDFAVLDIDKTKVYSHEFNKNGHNNEVIAEIRESAVQSREVDIGGEDKILLLSTCDKDSKHYRDVLLTKMIGKDENETQN